MFFSDLMDIALQAGQQEDQAEEGSSRHGGHRAHLGTSIHGFARRHSMRLSQKGLQRRLESHVATLSVTTPELQKPFSCH